MQIRIVFDHKEVEAMVNKMHRRGYSKAQIATAGIRINKAYQQFEIAKKKDEPSENQMSIDDVLKSVGGTIMK